MKKLLIISVSLAFLPFYAVAKEESKPITIELSIDDAFLKDIYHGNHASVEKVIESGIDVNAARDIYGRGALIWASMNDDKKMVDLLLKAGADPDMKDKFGNTAFTHASHIGDEELIALLLGKKYC